MAGVSGRGGRRLRGQPGHREEQRQHAREAERRRTDRSNSGNHNHNVLTLCRFCACAGRRNHECYDAGGEWEVSRLVLRRERLLLEQRGPRMVSCPQAVFPCRSAPPIHRSIRHLSWRPHGAGRGRAREASARGATCACCPPAPDLAFSQAIKAGSANFAQNCKPAIPTEPRLRRIRARPHRPQAARFPNPTRRLP